MKRRDWLILVGFLALTLVLRFSAFFETVIDWDETNFLLMGRDLLRGYAPYTTVYDHSPIGATLLFALAQTHLRPDRPGHPHPDLAGRRPRILPALPPGQSPRTARLGPRNSSLASFTPSSPSTTTASAPIASCSSLRALPSPSTSCSRSLRLNLASQSAAPKAPPSSCLSPASCSALACRSSSSTSSTSPPFASSSPSS